MKRIVNVEVMEKYMKDNNLSKSKFCKMCKISYSTLCKILKDDIEHMDIKQLFKVAYAMKVNILEILEK